VKISPIELTIPGKKITDHVFFPFSKNLP
jgi:hypothetical protein